MFFLPFNIFHTSLFLSILTMENVLVCIKFPTIYFNFIHLKMQKFKEVRFFYNWTSRFGWDDFFFFFPIELG